MSSPPSHQTVTPPHPLPPQNPRLLRPPSPPLPLPEKSLDLNPLPELKEEDEVEVVLDTMVVEVQGMS